MDTQTLTLKNKNLFTILKCHINSDKLEYVTAFSDSTKAQQYVDWKNCRLISSENEDTMYNYFIYKTKVSLED